MNKIVDMFIYVDWLDGYRFNNLDMQVTKAISRSFGHIEIHSKGKN
jgi:hypothetical protein